MRLSSSTPWQEDAIFWVHEQASDLPTEASLDGRSAKPSVEACGRALQIVRRHIPAPFAPLEVMVTPERGIEFDWENDRLGIEIVVFSDGSIVVTRRIDGIAISSMKLSEPDWRIGAAFAWMEDPDRGDRQSI